LGYQLVTIPELPHSKGSYQGIMILACRKQAVEEFSDFSRILKG
jgi:hypothetical protein